MSNSSVNGSPTLTVMRLQKKQVYTVKKKASGNGEKCEHEEGTVRKIGCVETYPVPDIDCLGVWDETDEGCTMSHCSVNDDSTLGLKLKKKQVYTVKKKASGNGEQCDYEEGDIDMVECVETCPIPDIDCLGTWVETDEGCTMGHCSLVDGRDKNTKLKKKNVFRITKQQLGNGEQCDYEEGDIDMVECVETCPIPNIDCIGEWLDNSKCIISDHCSVLDNKDKNTPLKKKQKYNIIKNKIGDGKACKDYENDERIIDCNGEYCAVPDIDCVGDWVGKKCDIIDHCSTVDGSTLTSLVKKKQVFKITQRNYGTGELCKNSLNDTRIIECDDVLCPVPDINCSGTWVDTGICTKDHCSTNDKTTLNTPLKKEQTFKILKNKVGKGNECNNKNNDIRIVDCDNVCPLPNIDCKGRWVNDEVCTKDHCSDTDSTTIGVKLKRKQTYEILENKMGNGEPCDYIDKFKQVIECNNEVCPVPNINCEGKWVDKTELCDVTSHCTNNKESKDLKIKKTQVYRITKQPVGNGFKCQFKEGDEKTVDCKDELCPIDCNGNWLNDTPQCNITDHCTNNKNTINKNLKRTQTFTVSIDQQGKGKQCEFKKGDKKTIDCIDKLCPIDCVGDMTMIQDCDKDKCSSGERIEKISKYVVKLNKQGDGEECNYNNEQLFKELCLCEPIDCSGHFEVLNDCDIDDYCNLLNDNTGQYKFRKDIYKIDKNALWGGKECKYLNDEVIINQCKDVKCDFNCNYVDNVIQECDLSMCNVDDSKVVSKIAKVSKNCEIKDIKVVNCSDKCLPKDCTYEISDYGACNLTECWKKHLYKINTIIVFTDTWLSDLNEKCINNAINELSIYLNNSVILKKKEFKDNTLYLSIELRNLIMNEVDDLSTKLNVINFNKDSFYKRFYCEKENICDSDKKCFTENTKNIIKKCDDTGSCKVNEYLGVVSNNNLKIENDNTVKKKRNINILKNETYGGSCDLNDDDLESSCIDECPEDCKGEWLEHKGCYDTNCTKDERSRNIRLKKDMIYKIKKNQKGEGSKCFDYIYGYGNDVYDGKIHTVECDSLCPIDCVENKTYSSCDIDDKCGYSYINKNGNKVYNNENARGKQFNKKQTWKILTEPQGSGKKCINSSNPYVENIPCSYTSMCPIDCVYY